MKRIFSLLMIMMLFTLPACTNQDEGNMGAPDEVNTGVPDVANIKVPEYGEHPMALYDDDGNIVVALGMTEAEVDARLGATRREPTGLEKESNNQYGSNIVYYQDVEVNFNDSGYVKSIAFDTPKYKDFKGIGIGAYKFEVVDKHPDAYHYKKYNVFMIGYRNDLSIVYGYSGAYEDAAIVAYIEDINMDKETGRVESIRIGVR